MLANSFLLECKVFFVVLPAHHPSLSQGITHVTAVTAPTEAPSPQVVHQPAGCNTGAAPEKTHLSALCPPKDFTRDPRRTKKKRMLKHTYDFLCFVEHPALRGPDPR